MRPHQSIVIAIGALIVLARCLQAVPHELATDEQRSFAAALLEFNAYGHQPPPPSYPFYVAAGKLLNFFVRRPLATLVTLSVASAVAGYVLFAIAFARLLANVYLGVFAAVAFYVAPPIRYLCSHPMPEPLAFACIAAALFFALRNEPAWFGVLCGLAVGARPQLIWAVTALVATTTVARPPSAARAGGGARPTLLSYIATVAVNALALAQNIGWNRLAWYMHSVPPVKGATRAEILRDFLRQPWSKATVLVFAAAAVGVTATLVRKRWSAVPLLAFTLVHLVAAIGWGARDESVRPLVPALIGIAFFAASSMKWRRSLSSA